MQKVLNARGAVEMDTATRKHKFAALGQAPYRLIGYVEAAHPAYDDSTTFLNHTVANRQYFECDHCGTPIKHVFMCESADGKKFNLGSVHVEQLGDECLTKAVHTKMTEVRREARKAKWQAEWESGAPERERQIAEREAQAADQAAKFDGEYARLRPALVAQPHPYGFRGKTLADYCEYIGLHNRRSLDAIRAAGGDI